MFCVLSVSGFSKRSPHLHSERRRRGLVGGLYPTTGIHLLWSNSACAISRNKCFAKSGVVSAITRAIGSATRLQNAVCTISINRTVHPEELPKKWHSCTGQLELRQQGESNNRINCAFIQLLGWGEFKQRKSQYPIDQANESKLLLSSAA